MPLVRRRELGDKEEGTARGRGATGEAVEDEAEPSDGETGVSVLSSVVMIAGGCCTLVRRLPLREL